MQQARHLRQTPLVISVLLLKVLRPKEQAFAPQDFG
jgi:hypothetical protein